MHQRLLTLTFWLLALGFAHADDWRRADVYLMNWETTTFVRQKPEDIRRHADFKRTFHDKAPAVRELLETFKMTGQRKSQPGDARLVVDYVDDTGQRGTYYASSSALFTADHRSKRPIDDSFRQQMTRLVKTGKRK